MNGGCVIQLILALICGTIAAVIAEKKGRSTAGWFFGGFFLGIIGVVIVAVLRNLKEEKAYRQSTEMERQRLREQLRQERLKSEALRQHVTGRLDEHDRALGMDTRNPLSLAEGTEGEQDSLPEPPKVQNPVIQGLIERAQGGASDTGAGPESHVEWFYELNGVTGGPITKSAILAMLDGGRLTWSSLVWSEALGGWTPAEQVPELRLDEGL